MKFVGQAGPISDALLSATTALRLNKKAPVKPADSAVRLAAIDGQVKVTCYDQCASISVSVPVTVIAPGLAATDAARTLDLFSNFGRDVAVTMTDDTVTCGDSKRYRLQTIPDHLLQDLPELPPPAGDSFDQALLLTSADVLTLLGPLWAADTAGSTRYYLASVFLQTVDDALVATSTDGKKLATSMIKAPTFSRARDLVLPESTAVTLRKLLSHDKPALVELRRSKKLIAFTTSRFRIVSRLIDFEYPDVGSVIPPLSDDVATVARAELVSALARLRATAIDADGLIALSWSHDAPLEIYQAKAPDAGIDVFEDATTTGRARFVVSRRLLALVVEETEGEHIEIIGSNPARLRAVGDDGNFALIAHCDFAFAEAAA